MTDEEPLPESPEAALALMDEWWPRWTAFIDAEHAAGRAEAPGADGWTLAEAVSHVARWQEWSVARATFLADGGRPEAIDVDTQNAAWAEQDRGVSFADARARADRGHAALRAEIARIPADRWRRSLGRLVTANTSHHYGEHMGWHAAGAP